jgi:hypothetical protein
MRFPTLSGKNLERKSYQLPQDLDGTPNVLLIAFQRWHQSLVDTWIPFLQQVEEKYPAVRYYELPTIQHLNPLSRIFINEGMRAGIPNSTARERTITLYLDKKAFREALDLPHEEDIYVLVVDRQGHVLWRGTGPFTPEKAESLMSGLGRRPPSARRMGGGN